MTNILTISQQEPLNLKIITLQNVLAWQSFSPEPKKFYLLLQYSTSL